MGFLSTWGHLEARGRGVTHSVPLPDEMGEDHKSQPCETQLCSHRLVAWRRLSNHHFRSQPELLKIRASEGVSTPVWAERRGPTHPATDLIPAVPRDQRRPRVPTRERAQRVAVGGSHGRLHPSRQPKPGPGPTFQVSQVPSASARVPSGPNISSPTKR